MWLVKLAFWVPCLFNKIEVVHDVHIRIDKSIYLNKKEVRVYNRNSTDSCTCASKKGINILKEKYIH